MGTNSRGGRDPEEMEEVGGWEEGVRGERGD
jgi:hypothetical protein